MKTGRRILLASTILSTAALISACQTSGTNDTYISKSENSEITPQVPTLAYDDTSVVLVWHKTDEYDDIVDYKIYKDGEFIGLSSSNNQQHSPAYPYIKTFFDADSEHFHQSTRFLNFRVTDLHPDTEYEFAVSAVYKDGSESGRSQIVKAKTSPTFSKVINITDYGAVGDGTTLNTSNIQQAIDDCAEGSKSAFGCKVVIPENQAGSVYVSGALFLASNMTLEIQSGATLKGSTDTNDYPLNQGYQLYSYKTNPTDSRRPPSLLNVLSKDHQNGTITEDQGYDYRRHVYENIRIVGGGTIDGSGWTRSDTDTQDETGNQLAYFQAGSREKVYTLGKLAYHQMIAAWHEKDTTWTTDSELKALIENTYGGYKGQLNKDLYSNRRSSLATFRGVTNLYFSGLKLINPAYHGVMFLEGENTVFAYNNTQTFDVNNADGVEFGNSENSMIFANFVDSGDDNINFAAGQGANYAEGSEHVQPTEKAWIFNNYMREGHGAVTIGSHTGAWVQDILAEENVMFLTDNGLRMKTTTATGGGGRRITFRDNAMKDIGTKNTNTVDGHEISNRGGTGNPFVFTMKYSAGDNVFQDAPTSAQFRDILVENVTLDNVSPDTGKNVIKVDGYDGFDENNSYPETYQENITFSNVKIKNAVVTKIDHLKDSVFKNVTVTNWNSGYDSIWQIKNSKNIKFENVLPEHANID
ncbi:glycosyl hydrolase family 28 protein [Gynuella sp.]|uniref:glycosyl hydrolase family 28 protein n=1 Tax=Gynuella sp. TaxID=2969146 RepID=UPI003D0A9477